MKGSKQEEWQSHSSDLSLDRIDSAFIKDTKLRKEVSSAIK